jgi:hypothetical protein
VDVYVAFAVPIFDPEKEVRVLDPCGHEIPSQVWNATYAGGKCVSANVVFIADCPASSSVTHTVLYNNPSATKPTYDGLRVYEEAADDTYNVTAVQGAAEKNYTRIIWKNLMNLYSNGDLVTWPGGPSGWEFSQINIGTLWSDPSNAPLFGTNKSLSLVQSGPVFMEFNYSEAGASDFYGLAYDYNVTTTSLIRIYYQPTLNPLVKFERKFNVRTNLANYTFGGPFYLDFNLANSTSQAIYKDFTYNEGSSGTTRVPVETVVSKTLYRDSSGLYGWWSYNGSRADSTDKPASNIGLIPTYSGGTIPLSSGGDYGLSVMQRIQNDDHHCSQYMDGKYNAIYGDYIQANAYMFTYGPPVNTAAELVMSAVAKRLRNPMTIQKGLGPRDVAITLLTTAKTVVGGGFNLEMNLTIANQGAFPECFCFEIKGNSTVLVTPRVDGVPPGTNMTIKVVWATAGFARGKYSIVASTATVPNEADTADNTYTDGQVTVTVPGNLNGDAVVDIYDAILLANAYNSKPGNSNWNPNADINGDNIVDIYDAIILANNYGKKA